MSQSDQHIQSLPKDDPDTETGISKEELGAGGTQGRASGDSHGSGERGTEGPAAGVMDQSEPAG